MQKLRMRSTCTAGSEEDRDRARPKLTGSRGVSKARPEPDGALCHSADTSRRKIIRKGDRARWFITGANRDPAKHENPDTFDISRWPNTHVAFGSGIHHCLGATLARMEGQEAFKALAQRYTSIEPEIDEFEYTPSITFRSVQTLPVSLR